MYHYFLQQMQVFTCKEGGQEMIYFIVVINEIKDKAKYEEYIRFVKPIVEEYGGRYLIRSNRVVALQKEWSPERVIVIEWDTREQLELCFSSHEYKEIVDKRKNSVSSRAIIVEE